MRRSLAHNSVFLLRSAEGNADHEAVSNGIPLDVGNCDLQHAS